MLDATCNVNFYSCNNLMSSLAVQLQQDGNCGADYRAQNPQVLYAYEGLIAYQPLYQAGCRKDPSGSYCMNDITPKQS